MRKNLLVYTISTLLLALILFFYITINKRLNGHFEKDEHYHSTLTHFQNLSRQVNNAAVLNPELEQVLGSLRIGSLFAADKKMISTELEQLKKTAIDSLNVKTIAALEPLLLSEIDWLLENNVPDIIIRHPSDEHIASFQEINTMIDSGIARTNFLIDDNNNFLNDEVKKLRVVIICFLVVAGILLIYTFSKILLTRK